MTELQVELKGVTKRYDRVIGVESLDLQIRKGEFFSLLGPSGCGKSTTLRLIAGFEQPDTGSVVIAGRPMQGIPPYKRNIGIVFQSYALFPHLDVFENIAFGLKTRRVPKAERTERVQSALRTVQLEGLQKRKPHQLSGGQQQRVALARAIVIEPDVLLLDEPLGALDKKLREDMQVRLVELHRQLNITTVYVTHDQEEALSMSDRIAVMSAQAHGVVQIDTPEALYRHPRSLFVANFIGSSNFLKDQVVSSDGEYLITERGWRVPAAQDSTLVVGDSATLAIRPEKTRLFSGKNVPPAAENRIVGIVEAAVFLGDSTIYRVQTEAGLIESKQFMAENASHATENVEVTVSWNPADTHVFPAA